MRMIEIFKNTFKEAPPPTQKEASEHAWNIYKYFVAPGSAFEVSVSHRRRKQTEVRAVSLPASRMIISHGSKQAN